VSVISALTLSPRKRRCGLFFRVHPRNIKSDDVVDFLRGLLRHLRGPIVLLWDRGLIHRGKAVKTYLAHRRRVQEEWFPAYAPELNPAEYVWAQSKKKLANGCPYGTTELNLMVQASLADIDSSQKLLRSCFIASTLFQLKELHSINYA
jgi:transposase